MAWTGKIIGGIIGSVVMPGWGTALGTYIGHVIDEASHPDAPTLERSEAPPPETAGLCICSFLGRMAGRTNNLNNKTRKLIAQIAFDVSSAPNISTDYFVGQIDAMATADNLFAQTVQMGQNDDTWRGLLLFGMLRLASIDNCLDEQEAAWIAEVADALGVETCDWHPLIQMFIRQPEDKPDLAEARKALGVTNSASADEIKQRYRELSRKYHPDIHVNADEVLRELTADKFKQIKEAYDLLSSSDYESVIYMGIAVETRDLKPPDSKGIVHCFFCDAKCRLPDRSGFFSSRCPKCQRLLLFDEETATQIIAANAEAAVPAKKRSPRPRKTQPRKTSSSPRTRNATASKATRQQTRKTRTSSTTNKRKPRHTAVKK